MGELIACSFSGMLLMTMRDMVEITFVEPFRPFCIHMENGQTFHVSDPEMVHVGKSRLSLTTWMSEYEEEAKMQEVVLLMNHISEIQFLDETNHDL